MRRLGITACQPFAGRLNSHFNDLMSDFFREVSPFSVRSFGLGFNIYEHNDKYHIEAELPGVAMEDLDITIKGNTVTLAGERKAPVLQNGETMHRQERWAGKFSREISLPVELDADQTTATLQNGVLTLSVPKSPKALPRKVVISQG
jgi:HSP20 family protein